MNEIFIIANNKKYKLVLSTLSLYFTHDIVEHKKENDGYLVIEIENNEFEIINSLKFQINNHILDINNFSNNIIKNKNMIEVYFENVFEMHDIFLNFVQNSLNNNYFKSALMCLSTQLTCNLSCEYCSMNCNKYKNVKIPSYDICFHKIKKIKDNIIKNKYSTEETIRYRIMGGETFLYPKIYNYVYKILNKISTKKRNNNILYLYTNLTVNIKKIINIVKKAKKDKYDVNLIASIDSFDSNISKRFTTKEKLDLFMNNIKKIKKEINDDCIFTISILSTNDTKDILNSFDILENLEIDNIKFGFDETKISNKDLGIKKNIIDNIKKTKYNKKFSTSKLMVDDFFIVNFILNENNTFILSTRTVNRVGHNIHKIYKYHNNLRLFFKKEIIKY